MLEICVTNLGKYNEGDLVFARLALPCGEEELIAALCSIGIDGVRYEEWFISDTDTDIDGLHDLIGEYENFEELNELADKLDSLNKWEVNMVEAVLEAESLSLEELNRILDDGFDGFQLYQGVDDVEGLGRYYIEECGALDIPDHIQPYFDYEAYGRDVSLEENGTFTVWGYLLRMA